MLAVDMTSLHHTKPSSSPSPPGRSEPDLPRLVQAARAHDDVAWSELVRRFDGRLRGIARSYRLNDADVDDVVQTVWLRLHQQFDRVRDPNAIAGWLTTATRRVALDVLQRHVREQLTDDLGIFERPSLDQPDAELLATERHEVLQRALGTLPAHQRRLMVLLSTASEDYREISAKLDMPLGSIGPTRARSLTRLRDHPELRELHHAAS